MFQQQNSSERIERAVRLDSSVVLAVFFREEVSDRAEKVVEKHQKRYTVSQVYPEVANAA